MRGKDDWECVCWGVYASSAGIRSCGEASLRRRHSGCVLNSVNMSAMEVVGTVGGECDKSE